MNAQENHIVDARYVQLVNYCALIGKDLDNQNMNGFSGLTAPQIENNLRVFISVLQETISYKETLIWYHDCGIPF